MHFIQCNKKTLCMLIGDVKKTVISLYTEDRINHLKLNVTRISTAVVQF